MPATAQTAIAVIGIDIGKNSFHVVGQDTRGQIVLRQKWSRHQVEARFANMPPCDWRAKFRRVRLVSRSPAFPFFARVSPILSRLDRLVTGRPIGARR